MNIMRKLVFLVVILGVIALSVSCQQSGLSEEEVRSIVREEVTRQLANVDSIVGQEVTTQLATVGDVVRQEVTTQLSSIDELTLSKLNIEADGKPLVFLGPDQYGHPMIRFYVKEKVAAELSSSSYGDGFLFLYDGDGSGQAFIGETAAGFGLYFWNRFGEPIFSLDTDVDGNGYLLIRDKYGQVTFAVP